MHYRPKQKTLMGQIREPTCEGFRAEEVVRSVRIEMAEAEVEAVDTNMRLRCLLEHEAEILTCPEKGCL